MLFHAGHDLITTKFDFVYIVKNNVIAFYSALI